MRTSTKKTGIDLYQVDAFADRPFKGNPAAVCILKEPLEDDVLQSIAAEMNLSETAFVSPMGGKSIRESALFSLRWFTPTVEVSLCGHATLATSAVLFYEVGVETREVTYQTRSGHLTARREEIGITLNFPAARAMKIEPPMPLLEAMGISKFENVAYAGSGKPLLIQLKRPEAIKRTAPDFERMKRAMLDEDIDGIIITSKGYPPYDFISRFFAPTVGIDEDPVTGAAHTVLTPYWAGRLGKSEMRAFQASARGGELSVRLLPDERVEMTGQAVVVFKGELYL